MDAKTRLVLVILAVAFGLGLLADALLRVGPWGINGALWFAVLAWVVLKLPPRFDLALPSGRRAFLPLALFFGACLAWRDSSTLKWLDVLALGSVFLACVLPSMVTRLQESTLTHWAMAGIDALGNALAGLPKLVREDVPLKEALLSAATREGDRIWMKQATAAFIGVVITVPLVLVFGGLFLSADRAFKAIVIDLFDVRWDTLISHLFVIGVSTWVMAGYLRLLLLKIEARWYGAAPAEELPFNAVTLAVPLIALDLLFLAFVSVQGRYMFGGEEMIQARTGMTYASYAREGFFQLVVVAILTLLFLLTVDWLARNVTPTGRRVLRAAMGALVGLVFVVLASALYRMRLYQDVYGFTELRVYTTAFMLWLAVVLCWFLATVLRGRRERFALGALLAGMAVVFGLHAFNPDANIVRWNLERIAEGKPFDARYAASLSADAVPALVKALPTLPEHDRNTIKAHLRKWAGANVKREPAQLGDEGDWRTWSWARHSARNAVERVK